MATPRRKIEDRDDAVALLEDLEASRMDLREFCRSRGVDGRSLQCWRRNLARTGTGTERDSIRLVELVRREPVAKASYRVHVDDLVVEVDDGFRSETLARLLQVVSAC